VSLDEIKSPLPPRKINMAPSDEPTERINSLDEVIPQPTPNNIPPTGNIPTPPKKNNKNLIIFGAVGGIVVLLAGLIFGVLLPKSNKTGSKGPVTITYWGLWEEANIMNSIIADFEAKNPDIKVNYKMNQKIDYRSRLAGRLTKTNMEEDVPDIFRIHATWVPMFRDYLAAVPSTTVKNLEMDNDFFDSYKTDLKVGNQYVAIPLMYDGLALFYNKDLLESGQVGIPKSWWDLKSSASKLTVKDADEKIKVAGAALGLVDNVDHWSDILGLMMKQNGVDPLSSDANNIKKMEDVLKFYTIFRTEDQVWDESLPNSTQMFASGKLAFYFGPSWRVFNINDMNKNLRYDITTVPQLPTLDSIPSDQTNADAKLTNIHWSSYWVEGVNSKSKYQKEAWKFLEYLASKEGLTKMYTTASQTRDFGEIYPRKSMASLISTNNKVKPFIGVADNASSWYLASDTYDDGLNDAMRKYFGDAINSLIKNNDMTETMTNLQNGVIQTKNKYQIK
jgi:ABC-type glycerol-3-phosphate transport system substrate-binding protein